MASEEHKQLAETIKQCHESLRELSREQGFQKAWQEHLENKTQLAKYAAAMHKLASIWEANSSNTNLMAQSRIKWTINYCLSYFINEKICLKKRAREERLRSEWLGRSPMHSQYLEPIPEVIEVLDIGSCFNPFANAPNLNVTAIDLHPATPDVLHGDFLNIRVKEKRNEAGDRQFIQENESKVEILFSNSYQCVIFSLLLEYIPSSDQRVECCRKAYDLLQSEGILIIITPDSQHVGKNAALMKNWRYTLATIGFMRICFEKLPHITCMVFRKSIDPDISRRWADQLNKGQKDRMSVTIEIPQDK